MMKANKWKCIGNNGLEEPLDKKKLANKRRKQFKQTMQIDRMPVNKPKLHNMPKRSTAGKEELDEE